MNDNKKWYKKLTTIFWWVVATIPIWYALIQMIFKGLSYQQTGSWSNVDDPLFLAKQFSGFVMSDLRSGFENLFGTFGINASNSRTGMATIFAWFIQAHLIHLVVDFILMLPKIAQKFIDKVCD